MAGTLTRGELSAEIASKSSTRRSVDGAGCIQFAIADARDDAELRRLLRTTAMSGAISISCEREPNYFGQVLSAGVSDVTIVARDRDRLVCMGRVTTRPCFINGEPRPVGYLGELRLDESFAGRIDLVRRGYQYFRELARVEPAEFYFTSIAAGNARARRVLERNGKGMPRYELLTEFVTLLVATRAGARQSPSVECGSVDLREFATFLNAPVRRFQLAPVWTAESLARAAEVGLARDSLVTLRESGRLVAAAALWDQRAFRQVVVRGYSKILAISRPWLNLTARLFRGARLPRVGSIVPYAFVSPFATERDEFAPKLVAALLPPARARGLELLAFGLPARDPRLELMRRKFRTREYRSRLYRVSWSDETAAIGALDGRAIQPEVALL